MHEKDKYRTSLVWGGAMAAWKQALSQPRKTAKAMKEPRRDRLDYPMRAHTTPTTITLRVFGDRPTLCRIITHVPRFRWNIYTTDIYPLRLIYD